MEHTQIGWDATAFHARPHGGNRWGWSLWGCRGQPEEYYHVGEVQREAPPRRTKCEMALALSKVQHEWNMEHGRPRQEFRRKATGVSTWGFALSVMSTLYSYIRGCFHHVGKICSLEGNVSSKRIKTVELERSKNLHEKMDFYEVVYGLTCLLASQE